TNLEHHRRGLAGWRRRCAFGPATSVRTLMHAAATPFFEGLGFDAPSAIEPVDTLLAATLRANGRPIGLLVVPWGERFDPLWRVAVTHAMRRASSWCLIFDGARLRVVDAGRVYARRHAEFDLDLAID